MLRKITLLIVALGIFAVTSPLYSGEEEKPAAKPSFDIIELKKIEDANLKEKFAAYFKPVDVKAGAKIEPYELPLDLSKVANFEDVQRKLALANNLDSLKKNGFVVIPWGTCEKITEPYDQLKGREVPIFVTSDTLLHLYHIQFDETLKDIEEREFYPDLVEMSKAMYETCLKVFNTPLRKTSPQMFDVLNAWKRNAIFFAVALSILEEEQKITPETLVEMPDEDFRDFLKKIKGASQDREFQRAWGSLMYTGRRELQDAKIVLKFYAPPARLPATEFPDWVAEVVKKERALIEAHEGFAVSPLFIYKEDYSQYVPRGHYTRRFILKKYFKAMMWYGRLTFIIKPEIILAESREEKERIAKQQTLQAALISAVADKVKVDKKRTVVEVWDRIYAVTAYYVGIADDLTLYEYRDVMLKVFGEKFAATNMLEDKKWFEFRRELALLRPPAIYSGTGGIAGPPVKIATEEGLKKALEDTKGLRFMGQRYIPDSYMMGKLVYPTVGEFKGDNNPFTLVKSDGGPLRGFPRGLDVMALLGSERARAILDSDGDTKYDRYDETMKKLADEFSKFNENDWNRNLYWSWLYSLKALLEPAGKGTQAFMQTEAWTDKQLNAALASWAELRHDTILYAKQSYTMEVISARPQPKKPVVGYVEPVPEFYARLLAMTQMTRRGLSDMNALDEKATKRLESLESILKQLLDISVKEIENKALTQEEYSFIRNFGKRLESVITGVSEAGEKTTMIADVHTDQNTKHCLEEGVGYVKMIVAAYRLPDGRILMGAGPVLSYYEFKQPIKERLTDEKWREMLKSDKAPEQPDWTKTFRR